jgi:GTP-binding protein
MKKDMKKRGVEFMTISAMARTGVRELLLAAAAKLADTPPLEAVIPSMPVYRPKEDPNEFSVKREGENSWRLVGPALERSAKMTYWEHEGSVRRFQKIMETLGVDDALRKAGVQEGDTVIIGDFELDWQE